MEAFYTRQAEIFGEFKTIHGNFKKDSASRKTEEYIQLRLERLEVLWQEAKRNHAELVKAEDKTHQYHLENIFEVMESWYKGARNDILAHKLRSGGTPVAQFDSSFFESKPNKLDGLLASQKASFRALQRLVEDIELESISERWEIEDELKALESRWQTIVSMHLQIDEVLEGDDVDYYNSYRKYELDFKKIKRVLNMKLNLSVHQQQSMPKIEIPTFNGDYSLWPTFKDMYMEVIHKNPALSKVQKMQHLKGRLRGEARKIVHHLHVSMENYDTWWDLLTHRYNNKQLLFTTHAQAFMQQPSVQKQSSSELKRLYDNSMEAIHAIHNLGLDTTTWDPILVHILCEKLDADTYADYMEARADPREMPSFDELMTFIENKFMALEPLQKNKGKVPESKSQRSKNTILKTSYFPHQESRAYQQSRKTNFRNMHNAVTKTTVCAYCNEEHALFQCRKFLALSSGEKLKNVTKLKICKNCLYTHDKGHCRSNKTCRECNELHNTLLHEAFVKHVPSATPTSANSNAPRLNPPRQGQSNFAINDEEEVLLATALVKVRAANGEYITLRALIDQGSQVTLITENATQRLGLQRDQLHASVSGVGTLSNKCRGKVDLRCKSLQEDFDFNTKALVMRRVVNNLPNTSFKMHNWEHVIGITLADPEYNISRPVDILLDAHVYTEILLSGLIKGQGRQPMAQQTKLGWILSGSVKTYNCHVVTHDIEDLKQYWEVEEISDSTTSLLSTQDQYCEDHYRNNTTRLSDGRYVVRIPMKPNYQELLGQSKPRAIAQFKQLERRFEKDSQLSDSYKQFMREYLQMNHMKEATESLKHDCYLPHHGVIKQDSVTTKLHTVFNASMKTASGYSLNDLMECGPKLHQDLQALLIQWRLHKYVLREIQGEHFKDEITKLQGGQQIRSKSSILSLSPFLDEENILRVGGRLLNSSITREAKQPMIVPHNCKLTDLLILQAHHQTLHGGPKLTLTHLRQRFWVVGGYTAVKSVIHKCVTCRRFSARRHEQIMADLPQPRVTISRPFTHTGVDFTGHIEVKANKGKGIKTLTAYIAIFVCLATKAIHLELVSDLSSMSFLAAFKRFCARRGKPTDMYSDNGTNFVGANRILLKQYREVLAAIDSRFLDKLSEIGINWHFNAPAWPTAGGLWESAVKSMKYHLKRVVGTQKLTFEEYTTLLCEIEACLNSRPLCTVTESKEDVDCLTPGHFLVGSSIMTIPSIEQEHYDLRKRWQLLQKIRQDFWRKWSSEYLQQLQARCKWQKVNKDTQLDDIVCIKEENLPAGRWALGRVVQLHPGKDGHTRDVTLKTEKGQVTRPITKIVPLLETDNVQVNSRSKSRSTRGNRSNLTLTSLLCYSLLFFVTLIAPSTQQSLHNYNVQSLKSNQTMYFDKIGTVFEIKDEWKLVVYYNMTSNWENVRTIDQYVTHLSGINKDNWILQSQLLINQLEQNLNELHYYNKL